MNNRPLFSIIICTYKRPELLKKCLLCLINQDFDHSQYEIIVSDDNVNDHTKKLVNKDFPTVTWIEGPRRGFAANRNNGASFANGLWLVFTDDDCLPDSKWLLAYYKALLEYPEIKVFEGRTIADRPKRRFDEEAPINELGGELWGCNLMVRKDFFDAIGGINERFRTYGMEDIEFKVRILKSENRIKFISDAVVIHPWRKTKRLKELTQVVDNIILFISLHPETKKHFTLKVLFKILIKTTIYSFISLIRFKFKGVRYFIDSILLSIIKIYRVGLKLNGKELV